MNNSDLLLLTSFAPLIQLWAAICLLFFYEEFFSKSPFSSIIKSLSTQFDNFRFRYILYLDTVGFDKTNFITDKWGNCKKVIKNLAALSFLYSAFILAFIGIENHSEFGANYFMALEIMDWIVLIFMVLDLLFIDVDKFHTYWTPILEFCLLLIYFHFHSEINEWLIHNNVCLGDYMTRNQITVFTVFTCISGVVLILIEILLLYIGYKIKSGKIDRTDNKIHEFLDNKGANSPQAADMVINQYYYLINPWWKRMIKAIDKKVLAKMRSKKKT